MLAVALLTGCGGGTDATPETTVPTALGSSTSVTPTVSTTPSAPTTPTVSTTPSTSTTSTTTANGNASPQVISTGPVFAVDISRSGVIYYAGVEGISEFSRVIKAGVTTNLPTMPGGYRWTTAYNPFDRPCVDDSGNVTMRSQSDATGRTVYDTHHYAFNGSVYTKLPMSTQDAVVVTCKNSQVLLGDSSGGSSGQFIRAYTWAQGSAALTALQSIGAATCVGCNATDTDWNGKTLYSTGLLNGATFTAHSDTGFQSQRLMPDGSVLGMDRQVTLSSWMPGGSIVPLGGQPASPMTLLDVNENGDILASSAGSVSWQWKLWLRKGTIWTEINPGANLAFVNDARKYYGLTNDGRFLVSVADATTSQFKALMLY